MNKYQRRAKKTKINLASGKTFRLAREIEHIVDISIPIKHYGYIEGMKDLICSIHFRKWYIKNYDPKDKTREGIQHDMYGTDTFNRSGGHDEVELIDHYFRDTELPYKAISSEGTGFYIVHYLWGGDANFGKENAD
jgi:hypothetical protein